jgi:hypothetical protein
MPSPQTLVQSLSGVREVRERELVVRLGGVALGLEDHDLVDLADLEVEVGRPRWASA